MDPIPARRTLVLILVPMLATVVVLRAYLHVVGVHHVYLGGSPVFSRSAESGGYLVHHLFSGALLVVAAALVLAFGPKRRWSAVAARVVLGIGSGMVLDEVTFLVMTRASDADYVSATSWVGSVVFVGLGVGMVCWLFGSRRGRD